MSGMEIDWNEEPDDIYEQGLLDNSALKKSRDLSDIPKLNLDDADDPPTPENHKHITSPPVPSSVLHPRRCRNFGNSSPVKRFFDRTPPFSEISLNPYTDSSSTGKSGSVLDYKDRYIRSASASCSILDHAQLQSHRPDVVNPFENHFASPRASTPRARPSVAISGTDSPLNFNSLRYYSDFDQIQPLSKSQVCTTFLVRRKFDHGYYFVKRSRLFRKSSRYNTVAGYDLFKEAQALSLLRHPNVVQYLSAWVESYEINLIVRYCAGGSLQDFKCPLGPKCGMLLSCQMTSALAYLHRRGILHGDLDARNILVDVERPRDNYSVEEMKECCESILHLDKDKCVRFLLGDFGLASLVGNECLDPFEKYASLGGGGLGRRSVGVSNPVLRLVAVEMSVLGDICERTISSTKHVPTELSEFLRALSAMSANMDRAYYEKWIVNNPLLMKYGNRPGCRSHDIFLELCEEISFDEWIRVERS